MRSGPSTWEGWRRAMTKVGLVTGPRTPRPSPTPRIKVVLPAPSSPDNSTTSPARSRIPSSRPSSTIASADSTSRSTVAERESPDAICDLVVGFELDHVPGVGKDHPTRFGEQLHELAGV